MPDFLQLKNLLLVAKINGTILSTTHCSAPSACKFWWKLVEAGEQEIYTKSNGRINEYISSGPIILRHLPHRLDSFF